MYRSVLTIIAAASVAACESAPTAMSLAAQATAAETPAALKALEARQLTEAEIRSELIGQSLDAGTRVWLMDESGAFTMRAHDREYTTSGMWAINGDSLCTRADICGAMFELGGVYRWATSADALAPYPITPR